MKKIFRRKALIQISVAMVAFLILGVMLRDILLKWLVVSTGQFIFRAKVEMASFDTSLLKSSAEIKGLQIADKRNPWKNLIQIDRLGFAMRFFPLLEKKIAIEEMAMENVRWQTARKTYGGLSRLAQRGLDDEEKNTLSSKLYQSIKKRFEEELSAVMPLVHEAQNIGEAIRSKDPGKLIEGTKLESINKIAGLFEESTTKYDTYKTDIKELKVEDEINKTRQLLNEVQQLKVGSLQDFPKVKDAVVGLRERKKALEDAQAKITTMKSGVQSYFSNVKDLTTRIDEFIAADYERVWTNAKLPDLTDKDTLARILFGRMWYERVTNAVRYATLLRVYIPPRPKAQKISFKPRARGIDVVFAKEGELPDFSIRKISVSGTTGGEGKKIKNPIAVAGLVADVSSDQSLHGKPTTLSLTGSKAVKTFSLTGTFDHMKAEADDRVSIQLNNLDVSENFLEQVEFLPRLLEGTYSVGSDFALLGENVKAGMLLIVKNMKFEIKESNNDFQKILNSVVASMNTLEVKAGISGGPDNLQTVLSSNLIGLTADKMKAFYGEKIQELQTKIKAEIQTRIAQEKEKLLHTQRGRGKELDLLLGQQQDLVREQKEKINQQIGKFIGKLPFGQES